MLLGGTPPRRGHLGASRDDLNLRCDYKGRWGSGRLIIPWNQHNGEVPASQQGKCDQASQDDLPHDRDRTIANVL
jgi:hypothetical protein